MRATSWESLPLLLTVQDLRWSLGLSRLQAYTLAHRLGIRVGRRLVIARAAVQRIFEEPQAVSR